jgi:hypothetical protein
VREQDSGKSWARIYTALIVILVVLVSVPIYFSDYREATFNISPRDDYSPYLLAMTGEMDDTPHRLPELFPGAPMAHRPLSVAIALPFYYILPSYAFSNLEEPDEPYLRATAALAFVSWIFMLGTLLLSYAIAHVRYRATRAASLIVALFGLALFKFVGLAGIDPLAIFLVALVIYFVDRPLVVVPVILLSAFTNEKVAIIAFVLYGGRFAEWLIRRRSLGAFRYWPQLVASVLALIAYVLFRRVVLPRPGYEGQLDPTTWLDTASDTIQLSLSLKGLVTNGVPLAVMAILVTVAWLTAPRVPVDWSTFRRVDVLVALALLLTAVLIGMEFTVGRLVLHAFPIYLSAIAVVVDRYLSSTRSATATPDPQGAEP